MIRFDARNHRNGNSPATMAELIRRLRIAAQLWEVAADAETTAHERTECQRRVTLLRGAADELACGGIERDLLQRKCTDLLNRARKAEYALAELKQEE